LTTAGSIKFLSRNMSKLYITTPIYYVNASPHIGHAYTSIIADCLARYARAKGDHVFYLTGTDEHGEKVKQAAIKAQQDAQLFVDRVSDNFKRLWQALDISYDYFIRTTQKEHIDVVRSVVLKLYNQGDIYKDIYRAFYCVACEAFWTETQVAEVAGCPDCKRAVEEVEEENYFFRLSKYSEWFKAYLKDNPDFIKPKMRYNEVTAFLANNTLADLCISRPKSRVSWGIELPIDADYVVYVWFDALINYITGVGCFYDTARFNKWWPADVHFIGKDILRHHAIFWPIMLRASGFALPKMVFAHGWWRFEGEKMSKSRGNIVNPFELLSQLQEQLNGNSGSAIDAVRYFMLREVPVGMDGNFSWQALVNRMNADLANDLGNLVFRTLQMCEKYFNSQVEVHKCAIPAVFAEQLANLQANYHSIMQRCEFSVACSEIFKLVSIMNKYIEDSKPWALWKGEKKDEVRNFLYALLEGIRLVTLYLYPVIPHAAQDIYRQLGLTKASFSFAQCAWREQGQFVTKKESPLFPRINAD